MDLWERGQYAGLVGDAEAEEAAREVRAAFNGKEEDNTVAGSSGTPPTGKLAGRGEGVSSRRTNEIKPGDRLQRSSGRSTLTCVSPL